MNSTINVTVEPPEAAVIANNLVDAITIRMLETGITSKQIADAIGRTEDRVLRIVRGWDRNPTIRRLAPILTVLGIGVEFKTRET